MGGRRCVASRATCSSRRLSGRASTRYGGPRAEAPPSRRAARCAWPAARCSGWPACTGSATRTTTSRPQTSAPVRAAARRSTRYTSSTLGPPRRSPPPPPLRPAAIASAATPMAAAAAGRRSLRVPRRTAGGCAARQTTSSRSPTSSPSSREAPCRGSTRRQPTSPPPSAPPPPASCRKGCPARRPSPSRRCCGRRAAPVGRWTMPRCSARCALRPAAMVERRARASRARAWTGSASG
mmetsp:Transcript_8937/g.26347  ORF Transcript_8937/g.26347 Transcript_8937/m.26347 type:complete len:238 (+) Transcript_8937:650-1363(+)